MLSSHNLETSCEHRPTLFFTEDILVYKYTIINNIVSRITHNLINFRCHFLALHTSCNVGSGVHFDLTKLNISYSRKKNIDVASCHLATVEVHGNGTGHSDNSTSEGEKGDKGQIVKKDLLLQKKTPQPLPKLKM